MDREAEPAGKPASRQRSIPWLRIATAAMAGLAVVALLLAGWFGIAWYRAANDPIEANANLREEVLREARQVIVNLEAIDYQTLDADLDRWESSITGPLLAEFEASRGRYADQIRQSQSKAEPTVVGAAVTELNPTAGTADVLVFVDLIVIEHRDGQETGRATKRQAIKLELNSTEQGWKAAAAGPVGQR